MKPVEVEILITGNFREALANGRIRAKMLASGLDNVRAKGAEMGQGVRKGADEASASLDRLKNAAKGALAGFSAAQFIKETVSARSEIESLQVSFETLMKSKAKGDEMFSQLMDYELKTPLVITDLAKAAQTMLGFNVAATDVMPVLKSIGDISMGNTERFQSLALAFSQMSATGKLMGQDLLQMINAGFNPLMVISEKTGKSIAELKDEMSKGSISSEQVKQAFLDAAGAGGQFNGMLDKMSKTTQGQISNLKGSITYALNDIGQATEGITSSAIGAANELVQNYQKVGETILELVAVYGMARATIVVATELTRGYTLANIAEMNAIILTEKAQALLNATIMKHPYAAAAAAAAALVVVIYKLATASSEAEKAQQRLDDATSDMNKSIMSEQAQIDYLFGRLKAAKKGTDEWKDAKQQILNQYGTYLNGLSKEISSLEDVAGAYRAVSKAARDAARARAMETYTKGEADKYAKQVGDVREEVQKMLTDTFGSKKGNEYYWKIVPALEGTGKLSKDMQKVVASFNKTQGTPAGTVYTYNQLQNLINRAQAARGVYNNAMRAAVNRFGEAPEEGKPSDDPKKKTITKNKKYYEDLVKTQQAQYDALTVAEKNSAKGKAIATKIRENQAIVDSYSVSKSDTAANKAATAALKSENDAAARAQKMREESAKWDEETRKQRQQAFYAQEEARIAQIQNAGEKEREERKLQHQKDLDQLAELEQSFRKANYEHNKTVYENSGKGRKYTGKVSDKENDLTADQQAQVNAQRAKIESEWTQYNKEQTRKEAQALNDYLKEYGSIQEQRLAIAKEYDGKIAQADSEGERLSLQAQKARALSDFDIASAKSSLNWEDIFGNLESFTRDQLAKIKEQLQGMLASSDLDTQGYKDVVSQIDSVNDAILSAEDKQRGFLGVAVSYNTERRKLEMDVADALDRQNQATQEMVTASAALNMQKFHTGQLLSGYGFDIPQSDIRASNANSILKKVGDKYGTDSDAYKKVRQELEKLAKTEKDYDNSVKKKAKADNDATQKQTKLNKYLDDFAEKLRGLMPLFEQINANIQDLPGLFETLGVNMESGLGKGVTALAEGTNSAMNGMKDFMSGNYVGAAMNGMKAVGSYVQSATNLFAGAGNSQAMEEEIARLSDANSDLAAAIDNLSESIEKSDNTNAQSVEAYRKAVDAEKQREANQRKMMNDRASEYSNSGHGFLGMSGRHSFNKYANDNRGNWLAAFNAALRQNGYKGNLRSAEDVWKLSPEELKAIQAYASKAWTAFFRSGGESNPKELVEEYLEMAGQLEDLTDSLNEKLTGYSWDSFKDSYQSLIQDLSSDTDDFADHINEVISNAILSSMVNEEFKDRIQAIYDYLAKAAEDDNLDASEVAYIRSLNEQLSEDMLKRRQQLIDAGLVTPSSDDSSTSQTGKTGSFTAMTQDQGTKLEGLFTNNLRHLSSIDSQLPAMAQQMTLAETHLARIAANSDYLKKLDTIAEDIQKIRRDGVKAQ